MTAGERLERARRVAGELGLPIEGLDRLAVPPRVAARLLSLSVGMVEKLIAQGELRAFRAGRAVRIELVDLVDFMERSRRPNALSHARKPASVRERAVALLEGRR